jgi:hypothetical protein
MRIPARMHKNILHKNPCSFITFSAKLFFTTCTKLLLLTLHVPNGLLAVPCMAGRGWEGCRPQSHTARRLYRRGLTSSGCACTVIIKPSTNKYL